MSYNANMIARAEHNLRANSQPTVLEFGKSVIITPGWFRRQVDRLMLKFSRGSARPAEIKQKYAPSSKDHERLTFDQAPSETLLKRLFR